MKTNIIDDKKRFILNDVEDLKNKYRIHLEELSKFPVWSRTQILDYLHIEHNTVKKFVDSGFLNEFKIGHFSYYSTRKKTFTNLNIRKSLMEIDSHYRIHYERLPDFTYDNILDDNSLVSRNVEKVGYILDCDIEYFKLYLLNPPRFSYDLNGDILIDKNIINYFNKIVNLLKDIKLYSNFERVEVHLIFPNCSKCFDFLRSYLDEKLILYNCSGYNTLRFKFVDVKLSNFNELLL